MDPNNQANPQTGQQGQSFDPATGSPFPPTPPMPPAFGFDDNGQTSQAGQTTGQQSGQSFDPAATTQPQPVATPQVTVDPLENPISTLPVDPSMQAYSEPMPVVPEVVSMPPAQPMQTPMPQAQATAQQMPAYQDLFAGQGMQPQPMQPPMPAYQPPMQQAQAPVQQMPAYQDPFAGQPMQPQPTYQAPVQPMPAYQDPFAGQGMQPQPMQPPMPAYQPPMQQAQAPVQPMPAYQDPFAGQPIQPQPTYQAPVQPMPAYQDPFAAPMPQAPMPGMPPMPPMGGGGGYQDPFAGTGSGMPIAGGAQAGGQAAATEPEDKTPANFQLGKDLPAELGVPVPDSNLNYDGPKFMRLLAGSISLDKAEKKRIIDAIPKLKQTQIDELINIFEDEKTKFAELPKKHTTELDKLAKKHLDDWLDIEAEYKAKDQKDDEAKKAEEIRKSLGL
jgi:hypothetical protein